MSAERISNRERAPQCAAFVQSLRDVFGDVAVLYVEENGLRLGEPTVKHDPQQRAE